uniref:TPR_REGION domain-containing protein n=1 Tax=Syphacia muris TaxID=451379 RepID=A0A0N5AKE9_9BILA
MTSSSRNASSSIVRALPSSSGVMHTSAVPRKNAFVPRPLTAVRAAGYKSNNTADPRTIEKAIDDGNEDKCRQLENEVNILLEQSIKAWENGEFKLQAGRKERLAVRLREQLFVVEQLNLDLTFTVLLNLAHQYMANDLLTEALKTYQMIVKNKMFSNTGRLKVNIGNIYFKKKDYEKAIKYYRMAFDQVPNTQNSTRIKILNNIGVAFIKLGEYEEAANTFGFCLEERGDYGTALNMILTAYCLEDVDKMKESFQQLVDIPRFIDDEPKYIVCFTIVTSYFFNTVVGNFSSLLT